MGQSQSQQHRPISPNQESNLTEEERAQAQAEMRARQQAALDKRLASQATKKPTATATASASARPTKKPTALEEMSTENVGWRNADAQNELRNWN